MRNPLLVFVVGLVGFSPTLSLAQSSAQCLQALVQDKGYLDAREASSLATWQLLERSSSSNTDISGGLTVPIEGVPIQGKGAYMKAESDRYMNESNLNWTQERLVSVATQTLSANAVDAFKACMNGNRSGPRITVYNATPTQATIKVQWIAPVNAPTETADVAISTSGGQFDTSAFPRVWRTGQAFSAILTRDPKQDLRLTANIGGETDNEFVAFLPPVISGPRLLKVGSCLGHGGLEGVRLWGPADAICNDVVGWGRYDAQVTKVTELGSCVGHGGVEGVRLYGPVGERCAGMNAPEWGTYQNGVNVLQQGIASCVGHGNILEGHRLWGPTGQRCGGMNDPGWGSYSEYQKKPG